MLRWELPFFLVLHATRVFLDIVKCIEFQNEKKKAKGGKERDRT